MFAEFTFELSGPLFDGRLEAAVARAVEEAEQDIADYGVLVVREELGHVLRAPTGYYASQIQTDRARSGVEVSDGGVVYGPWLAGSSERNQSTRFKGYAHWRAAKQRLQASAVEIADRDVAEAIRSL